MEEKQNWTYCVVGNIKKCHFDGGGILRHGTAAFTGGTKVYLAGRGWDRTTRQINALGMTRNKRKQIVRTDVSQIENIRLQKAFDPAILELMDWYALVGGWWGKSKKEKTHAEAFVKWWNEAIAADSKDRQKSHRQPSQAEVCRDTITKEEQHES